MHGCGYKIRRVLCKYDACPVFRNSSRKAVWGGLPYLETGRLDAWTIKKTIQKAVKRYRINSEQKYLRGLSSRKI